jgi:septum formation protein
VAESLPPRLILASASPRRRELMGLLGLPFEVIPSRYEEPGPPTEPVDLAALVTLLAANKAQEVASRTEAGLVLGADTLVTLDQGDRGVPLGKPIHAEQAHAMLRSLAGNVHCVYTGIALIRTGRQDKPATPLCAAVKTRVRFRELSDRMIADYIATGEPMDKAGAYGAQGYAAPFIESFEGDFFNVVGLPLCAVGRLLEKSGIPWWRYRTHMPSVIG